LLVNEKSGIKSRRGKFISYYGENDIDKHYFSKDYKIYSDKLSKFVVRCNEASDGCVIDRISALFRYIFIDEIQDMAGDPRQVTYHTHFPQKYKKYANGKIEDFIISECKSLAFNIDNETLRGSWRNNQIICDFANRIFPDYPKFKSLQTETNQHKGVFLVREKDITMYLEEYKPIQLRYSRAKNVNLNYKSKNFGESKGGTFNHVLIYPTAKIENWLFNNEELDNFEIKCKFYVVVTRARHSVAIVCKNNVKTDILPFYK